jgi:hypothetical protein
MKQLVNTDGKTWYTWQYDLRADLRIGVPVDDGFHRAWTGQATSYPTG